MRRNWRLGALRSVGPRRALTVPRRTRLGDSTQWVDAVTGQPVDTTGVIQVPPDVLPPPTVTYNPAPAPADLTQFFTTTPLPSVTPSTLLQAAALPNAPAAVKQAAAQYSAANPVTAALSGSTGGLPNVVLFGGAGLLLLVLVMSGGKGRR